MLWQTISGSKLLAKVNTIIFLKKIDLLTLKLRFGVKIKQYIPCYGDKRNDMEIWSDVSIFFPPLDFSLNVPFGNGQI